VSNAAEEEVESVFIPDKLVPVFTTNRVTAVVDGRKQSHRIRVRGAYGGRGSGKTRTFALMSAIRGYELASAGKRGRIVCGREYMNSLDDSSMLEIKEVIASIPWLADYYDVGEKYIRTKNRRIEFSFVGMHKNIDSIKSKAKIHLFWADEAEGISDTAWSKVIPTVREHNSEIWVTWNPELKTSSTDKRFRKIKDPDMLVVELNYKDNKFFPEVMEVERQRDLKHNPDNYAHIWEGGYKEHVSGAYYSKHLIEAKNQGRIGRVAADPLLPIKLFCDIGGTGKSSDAFSIWAAQFVGREVRVLSYYEAQGQEISDHLGWMRGMGYTSDKAEVYLPHDGATNDKVHRTSYESAFQDAGYKAIVIPNQGKGAAQARIEAVRRLFPSMWFNEATTVDGVYTLGFYKEKRDEKRDIGLGPDHDFASHCADAMGLLAVAYKPPRSNARRVIYNSPRMSDSVAGY